MEEQSACAANKILPWWVPCLAEVQSRRTRDCTPSDSRVPRDSSASRAAAPRPTAWSARRNEFHETSVEVALALCINRHRFSF